MCVCVYYDCFHLFMQASSSTFWLTHWAVLVLLSPLLLLISLVSKQEDFELSWKRNSLSLTGLLRDSNIHGCIYMCIPLLCPGWMIADPICSMFIAILIIMRYIYCIFMHFLCHHLYDYSDTSCPVSIVDMCVYKRPV